MRVFEQRRPPPSITKRRQRRPPSSITPNSNIRGQYQRSYRCNWQWYIGMISSTRLAQLNYIVLRIVLPTSLHHPLSQRAWQTCTLTNWLICDVFLSGCKPRPSLQPDSQPDQTTVCEANSFKTYMGKMQHPAKYWCPDFSYTRNYTVSILVLINPQTHKLTNSRPRIQNLCGCAYPVKQWVYQFNLRKSSPTYRIANYTGQSRPNMDPNKYKEAPK